MRFLDVLQTLALDFPLQTRSLFAVPAMKDLIPLFAMILPVFGK